MTRMSTMWKYSAGLVIAFGIGYVSGPGQQDVAHAQAKPEKAAYLVASLKIVKPEQMTAYGQAAGPLAKQAGMQMLGRGQAGSTIQVLEGKWPFEGGINVEKFRSMPALLEFWNSPGYQKAKKLREGAAQVNFIVAVEAVD